MLHLKYNEKHPDYDFDTIYKKNSYEALFERLKSMENVTRALTFPNLSNFRMERELEKKYPNMEFDCFEKDPKIYKRIESSFDRPKSVHLFNKDALEYLRFINGTEHHKMYDLIYIDSCGKVDYDVCDVALPFLKPGGVLAVTQDKTFRKWEPYRVDLDEYSLTVAPYCYARGGHIEFLALRKNTVGRSPEPIVIKEGNILGSFFSSLRRIGTIRRFRDSFSIPGGETIIQPKIPRVRNERRDREAIRKAVQETAVAVVRNSSVEFPKFSLLKSTAEYKRIIGNDDLESQILASFNGLISDIVIFTASTLSFESTACLMNSRYHTHYTAPKIQVIWDNVLSKLGIASKKVHEFAKYYRFLQLVNSKVSLKGLLNAERSSVLSANDILSRSESIPGSQLQGAVLDSALPV